MAQEKLKVTIRFNDELKEKLQQKAKEEDLSLNQIVVRACKKLIKEMETKNDKRGIIKRNCKEIKGY